MVQTKARGFIDSLKRDYSRIVSVDAGSRDRDRYGMYRGVVNSGFTAAEPLQIHIAFI